MDIHDKTKEELIIELRELKQENPDLKALRDECVALIRRADELLIANKELAFQQDNLKKSASRVPGVVYQYLLRSDGTSCFPFASEAIIQIYRVTPEEVRDDATKVSANLHPDDYDGVVTSIQTSAKELSPWQHEYRVKFDDGDIRSLYGNAVPEQVEDGSVLWHGFITDITERKQAEEKLREIEEKFKKTHKMLQVIINAIPQHIFWKDRNSVYLGCNQRGAQVAGLSHPSEIVGKTDYDLSWKKEEADFFRECDQRVMQNNAPELHIFEPQLQADGKNAWLDTTKLPLYSEDGTVNGIIVAYEDITAQKAADLEILRQAGLIKSLLTSIPDIVFFKDCEGVYLGCNPLFVELVGKKSEEEVIGKTDYDLFDKEMGDFFRHHDNEMLKQLSHRQNEEEVTFPDGRKILIDTLKTPYRDKNGDLIGILGISRDITDKKMAEAEMVKSQNQLNLLFSQSLSGFFFMMLDEPVDWSGSADKEALLDYIMSHHRITKVNQAMLDQYGAKEEDFIGLTVNDLFAHDLQYGRKIWKGFFEQGRWHLETQERKMDGTPMVVEGDYICLYDEQGRITGHFGVQHDVTDKRKMEREIRESEDRYNRAISGTGAGLWDWDMVTNTVYFSPQWKKMLGYEDHEIPNDFSGWRMLWHPDEVASNEKDVNDFLEGTSKVYEVEHRLLCKDGSWHWILTRGDIEKDANGKPIRWTGTNIDITERKKAEDHIIIQNKELQSLNAQKDKFFSIIAHDLRSPFNSIIGLSEILVERINEKDYDGIENYARIILQSSHRAMNLLNNLMEWAQSQTDRMEFNQKHFDITEFIQEITLMFEDIAGQKGIVIKKELPLNAIVFADQAMINTVLRNLISNAVKFTKPGGEIIVSVNEEKDKLMVSVKDNGIGIPKEVIGKLFRIDENYSTRGTANEAGTGLGLILCKEFIEKHEEKIWVESEEGNGSTFYFTLPYTTVTAVEKTADKELLPDSNTDNVRKLKILIAEDDDVSEMLITINVNDFSKEILKARTGVEAVEACRNNLDIDLVLMDIRMPEMSGYEAVQKIRELNKEVIIIAQTAQGLAGDKEKAIRSGCNDYISKPVNKDELLQLLQKNLK